MADAPQRNILKLVRDLQRRKARERRDFVILEGRRLVEDALGAGARVVAALAADDAGMRGVLEHARGAGADVETIARQAFDEVAGTTTPSGILAVAEWSPTPLDKLPAPGRRAVALVLDAVQDPGNVGTMIRTAHALGAWCTIALDGTADVRGPKVLRAAMGSHFRHRVAEASFHEFVGWAQSLPLNVVVATASGDLPSHPMPDARFPAGLVIGSEGRGVRDSWGSLTTHSLSVPMPGDAESINAAVAAGILLYELTRVA